MNLLDAALAPLAYPFMQRALVAAVMVGLVCALVGTFAVLRGMSYLGTAISHSLVPGVAVGFVSAGAERGGVFWWATAAALLTALGIGFLVRRTRLREDAAIGVMYSGMFALGVGIISSMRSFAVDLVHFLFGNVLAVSAQDLVRTGVVSALICLVLALFYKEIVAVTFDQTFAESLRLPTGVLTYLQFVLMALAIVVALETVGITLVVALMVTPAAAALQITRRLGSTLLVAAAIGVVSGVSGLYVSYYLDVASGPGIVLVSFALFLLVSAGARLRGLRPT